MNLNLELLGQSDNFVGCPEVEARWVGNLDLASQWRHDLLLSWPRNRVTLATSRPGGDPIAWRFQAIGGRLDLIGHLGTESGLSLKDEPFRLTCNADTPPAARDVDDSSWSAAPGAMPADSAGHRNCIPVILVTPTSRSYSWGWCNVPRIAQLRVSRVLVDVEVVSERLTNLGSIRVVGKVLEMRVGPAQNAMPSRLIRMLESWAEPRTYRLRLLVDVIIDQEGHDRSSQAWSSTNRNMSARQTRHNSVLGYDALRISSIPFIQWHSCRVTTTLRYQEERTKTIRAMWTALWQE